MSGISTANEHSVKEKKSGYLKKYTSLVSYLTPIIVSFWQKYLKNSFAGQIAPALRTEKEINYLINIDIIHIHVLLRRIFFTYLRTLHTVYTTVATVATVLY